MIDEAIDELTPTVGVRAACVALGESRARHYRRHRKSPAPAKPERVAMPQPRALSDVASTWDRSPPCTGSSASTMKSVTGDVMPPTRPG